MTYPIEDILPQLKSVLHEKTIAILQAPPGAGKSTILPLQLLEEKWLEGKKKEDFLQGRLHGLRGGEAERGVGDASGHVAAVLTPASVCARIAGRRLPSGLRRTGAGVVPDYRPGRSVAAAEFRRAG